MDSVARTVDTILGFVAEDLDIPPPVDAEMRTAFDELSAWIRADHATRFRADSRIFQQGSRRIGTMVRPVHPEDDHDVDLVYLRDVARTSVTRERLKEGLGEQLAEFIRHVDGSGGAAPELDEGARCWTLRYPRGFHMDILPALPNDERKQPEDTSILITDRNLAEWQVSDPQAYAEWFLSKGPQVRKTLREELARAGSVEIEDIPDHQVRTPLQRAVQVLKRHRDLRFEGNREDKPSSILITTLAALTYNDGDDLFRTLRSFAVRAVDFVEVREDGIVWVQNPTNPEENFADRWRQHPSRKEAFFSWLGRLTDDLDDLARDRGLDVMAEKLSKAFGAEVKDAVIRRYGGLVRGSREKGNLLVGGPGVTLGASGAPQVLVRRHTFFGES